MTAFVGGIIFGALLMAGLAVLFLNRLRRPPRQEPIDWQERAYQPPVVVHHTHQSINRIREINL